MQTTNVYSIGELSQTALERAHADYLSRHFEYLYVDEGVKSIEAFCAQFGAKTIDYNLSTWENSHVSTNATNLNFRGIGADFIPAEFPTGYCIDEALRTAYFEEFKATGSAKKAFDAAIDAAVKSIVADMHEQETLEYFIEHAEANDYQFLDDGRMI